MSGLWSIGPGDVGMEPSGPQEELVCAEVGELEGWV